MKRHSKTFAFKADDFTENTIKGDASVIGVLDSYRDVMMPGCFPGEVLAQFLKGGFIATDHDWRARVGYPTVAEMRGRILYGEAVFHSTQAAQDARTVAKERIEGGCDVALSIGFGIAPGGYKTFPNGEALLKWAGGAGYDLSQLDTETIAACSTRCAAITKVGQLFEWSIVGWPANPETWATSVKGIGEDGRTYFPQFKGEFLGEYAEAEAAWSALISLGYDLKYRALWYALFGYGACEGMDAPARMDYLRGAFDEYTRLSLAIAEALMPMIVAAQAEEAQDDMGEDDDEGDGMMEMGQKPAAIEQRFRTILEAFASDPNASRSELPAGSVGAQADAALATVDALRARMSAIADLRQKDGRKLSTAHGARLKALADSLTTAAASLADLAATTEPQPPGPDVSALLAQHLQQKHALQRSTLAA